MLCSKILVAYDHSDLAQRALEKALEIAKMDQTIEIQIVHVIKVPDVNSATLMEAIYLEGKNVITKVEISLPKLPNHFQTFLLEGKSPALVILNHAQKHNCDLIVMGSRGLSGIKEFLGSVSHTVVHSSHIPILIVK